MWPYFALEIVQMIAEGINLSSKNQRQARALRGGDCQMRRFFLADPSQPKNVSVLLAGERKFLDCDSVLDYTEQAWKVTERLRLRFRDAVEAQIGREVSGCPRACPELAEGFAAFSSPLTWVVANDRLIESTRQMQRRQHRNRAFGRVPKEAAALDRESDRTGSHASQDNRESERCARARARHIGRAHLPALLSRVHSPYTLDPSAAATVVRCPAFAISRSTVSSICSAPPALSSVTARSGYATYKMESALIIGRRPAR